MSNYVNLLDIVYPVGAVYISNNSTTPASIVGGTWTKVAADTFICSGTPNATGGQNSFIMSTDQMPKHRHTLAGTASWIGASGSGNYFQVGLNVARNWNPPSDSIDTVGGNAAIDNRPKYRAFNVYYRTA